MLSFEKVSSKDVLIARIYESDTAKKPVSELWFTPKFKGASQIVNDDVKELIEEDKLVVLREYGLSELEFDRIVADIQQNKPMNQDFDRSTKKAYLHIQNLISSKLKREFIIPNTDSHSLRLNYDTSVARRNYITSVFGAPGAGKSYSICEQILADSSLFHYPHVYLIGASAVADDPSFEPLKDKMMARYSAHSTADLPREMYDMKHYERGACIIFDDCSSEPDPKRKKAILLMRDRMISVCRHKSLRIWCTEHVFHNYRVTAKMRNNSRWCFVFPRSVPKTFLDIMERQYAWKRNRREALLKKLQQDGRLVIFSFQYPQFCLSRKRLILL